MTLRSRLGNRSTSNVAAMVAMAATAVSFGLASVVPAGAHDATGESIVIELNDQRSMVTARVPFEAVGYRDTSGDGLIDVSEIEAQVAEQASELVEIARANATIRIDGTDAQIIAAGVAPVEADSGEPAASPYVTLGIVSGPHDGDVSELSLDWLFESPSSSVVLSHADGVTTGSIGDDGSASFSLGLAASISSFFELGIEHIRFGPDHLLFLVVLTLTVAGTTVSRETTWRAVKLVTAFTIGHAISLGLAYFEVLSLPAGLVEPAISLSIVVAAIMAITGRGGEARPLVALGIGLIHGLGFASSLSSLGVVTSQRVPALAAFNLGIDLAQTAVVLIVIAGLWLASQALEDRMAWVRVPTAAIAAVIGLAWTVSRVLPEMV